MTVDRVKVDRVALAFHNQGIGRGDRIAILSENRAEYLLTQMAAAKIGAIVACQLTYWALSATARWDYPPTGIRPSSGIGLVTGSFRECTPAYSGDPESSCG